MATFENMEWGFPWWCSGWESACQCRGHGFEPWSEKIPRAAEQLSPCATNTEPTCRNYWSPCIWSPCSTTREATAVRSPRTTTKSGPREPQLEKARSTQQQRPNAAKNKINKFIYIKKRRYGLVTTTCVTPLDLTTFSLFFFCSFPHPFFSLPRPVNIILY